jgi:hypothetical protein
LVIDEKNVITSYNQIFCGNAGGFWTRSLSLQE